MMTHFFLTGSDQPYDTTEQELVGIEPGKLMETPLGKLTIWSRVWYNGARYVLLDQPTTKQAQ